MRKLKAIILCLLLLWFLSSTILRSCRANNLVCNEKEKQALLDPANQLSSWSIKEDCCGWRGVHCSNASSRVLKLKLADLNLAGEISSALLKLDFLGSMGSIRFLDLSSACFGGLVPPQLGNISKLRHLYLGGNGLYIENLSWISHLSSLKYLDMDGIDLHRGRHWLEPIGMLPSPLADCQLDSNMTSSLGYANFSSLTFLDLSYNNTNQELPNW
ncbi:hypothetical protein PVL29_021362 [Vitis rotundifolia]|uniref:Leucine-rich repeat-containing N-terminal plant-type domain-containing protein n=1 Tax=Vitis rotundifolia TaxID=103349 RepID=A0AA39DD84_VITRO|nr:hypothetical protein PVL29_021362 [Vitis rotundifolia]